MLLQLEDVGYRDGDFQVLSHINWELQSHSLYQIIGGNSSGKSALLRLIAGINPITSGRMLWKDKPVVFGGPHEASRQGIAYLMDTPQLFQNVTAAENVATVPRLSGKDGRFLNKAADLELCASLFRRFDIPFAPDTPVFRLSLAQQRIVELLRCCHMGASLLLMDALSGWISPKELEIIGRLLEAMNQEHGASAIVCASTIDRILPDAAAILYLKFGRPVACVRREERDVTWIPPDFRSEHLEYPKLDFKPGRKLLELRGFQIPPTFSGDSPGSNDFIFQEREIVGIYGMDVPHCEAICQVLTGRRHDYGGEILVRGLPVKIQSPRHALRLGIACQALRTEDSLFQNLSVRMNLTPPVDVVRPRWFSNTRFDRIYAALRIQRMHIKDADGELRCSSLSSATRQKILLVRYLAQDAKLFVLFHPTYTMDYASKLDIFNLMTHLQRRGCGIILFSSDIDELAYMCDRIYVAQSSGVREIVGNSTQRANQLYRYLS